MAATLAAVTLAATRRQMTPAALTTPMATTASAAAAAAPAPKWPLSNRGATTRSTTLPSTHDWPTIPTEYTAAPSTAIAKGTGRSRTWRQITWTPRRRSPPVGGCLGMEDHPASGRPGYKREFPTRTARRPPCRPPPRAGGRLRRVRVEPEVGDVRVRDPRRELPLPDPGGPEERLALVHQRHPGGVVHDPAVDLAPEAVAAGRVGVRVRLVDHVVDLGVVVIAVVVVGLRGDLAPVQEDADERARAVAGDVRAPAGQADLVPVPLGLELQRVGVDLVPGVELGVQPDPRSLQRRPEHAQDRGALAGGGPDVVDGHPVRVAGLGQQRPGRDRVAAGVRRAVRVRVLLVAVEGGAQ